MHKLGSAVALALGSAFLTGACGGVSEGNAMFADNGGSPSGSSASGAATLAGSTNAAAGTVETAVGGVGVDPGPGAAGEPPVGQGKGGEPSVPTPPDPTVKEGCADWCAGVVAASCSKKTTLSDCVFGCRAVSNSAPCNARYKQLFECSQGATFTCNKDGDAVPQGCEAKYALTGLCVLSNPDQSLAMPCQAYCDHAEAAACPNSSPASECAYGCELQSSFVPSCAADWKAFVTCAQTAEVKCTSAGDPSPEKCAVPYLEYLTCVAKVAE
jgi:hypothetical protein